MSAGRSRKRRVADLAGGDLETSWQSEQSDHIFSGAHHDVPAAYAIAISLKIILWQAANEGARENHTSVRQDPRVLITSSYVRGRNGN